MLWAISGAVICSLLAFLTWVVARRHDRASALLRGVHTCRSADAGGDRNLETGAVKTPDVATANSGIRRRLLRSYERLQSGSTDSSAWLIYRRLFVIIALVLVPPTAAVVYLMLEHSNQSIDPGRRTQETDTPIINSQPSILFNGAPPTLEDFAKRLETQLKVRPHDAEQWELLGRTYSLLGRYSDAVDAFRKGLALEEHSATLHSGLGVTLVLAARGNVGPDAVTEFKRAKTLNPADAAARYYLGLADFQVGRLGAALEIWAQLAREAPADAPWLPGLRQQITAIASELGIDPKNVLSDPVRERSPAGKLK